MALSTEYIRHSSTQGPYKYEESDGPLRCSTEIVSVYALQQTMSYRATVSVVYTDVALERYCRLNYAVNFPEIINGNSSMISMDMFGEHLCCMHIHTITDLLNTNCMSAITIGNVLEHFTKFAAHKYGIGNAMCEVMQGEFDSCTLYVFDFLNDYVNLAQNHLFSNMLWYGNGLHSMIDDNTPMCNLTYHTSNYRGTTDKEIQFVSVDGCDISEVLVDGMDVRLFCTPGNDIISVREVIQNYGYETLGISKNEAAQYMIESDSDVMPRDWLSHEMEVHNLHELTRIKEYIRDYANYRKLVSEN